MRFLTLVTLCVVLAVGCARSPEPAEPQPARHVVLITIDTLRADRLGAYGYAAARTPAIDALAARGTRFDRAYATAPITLTSHASLLSGRYPAGHGARHNGLRMDPQTPLLTEHLARAGFATAAFVSAFPLDRRFGLDRGFQTYGDRLPRTGGRPSNERAGEQAVDEAIAWLRDLRAGATRGAPSPRFFLWVHLFEPHAPYGRPGDRRPAGVRYDEEIAESDRQTARLLDAVGPDLDSTVVVFAADHGEAFGEHGEIAHSIFVYDTTLRVPLVIAGPGIGRHTVSGPVSLVDVAPTLTGLLRTGLFDADGVDLGSALQGGTVPERALYAESFAPLLDFGWSPLRSIREGGWKLIDAPRPELYHVSEDSSESRDLSGEERPRVTTLRDRVQRYSPPSIEPQRAEAESAARLQALGYVGSGRREPATRADPKDRRELAADIARVTSGELAGRELESVLRRILDRDPANPQANMRLGYVLLESDRCAEALRRFATAIDQGIPGAEAHLGRAGCHAAAGRFHEALSALGDAERAEPGSPVVLANQGIVLSDSGRPGEAVPILQRAVATDPDFHEARFNLAIAFARLGKRFETAREAQELLRRLPPEAPQRPEVERLLNAAR